MDFPGLAESLGLWVISYVAPRSLADLCIEVEATLFIPILVRIYRTPGALPAIVNFLRKLGRDHLEEARAEQEFEEERLGRA